MSHEHRVEWRSTLAAEIRADAAGRKLGGYAAVFGASAELGGFTEVIRRGAFGASLRAKADVVALVDHLSDRMLGRTTSGTLRLTEDTRGLAFEVDVPATSIGNDVLVLAQRGDLAGMSFGFRIVTEAWPDQRRRELRAVNLIEISVISGGRPAYPGTSVQARHQPRLVLSPLQRRRLIETL